MRKTLGAVVVFAMLFATLGLIASAQDQTKTWTGWISDSSCGAKGMSAAHRDCAVKCVKEHSAKWVFADTATKTVFNIHNQDSIVPETALGQEVNVTGHVMEDGSIHIDNIGPATPAK
jgi:hypothetical protein